MKTADNQAVVEAINKKIGSFTLIYGVLVVFTLVITLQFMYSSSEREKLSQEFIEYKAKTDLNTEASLKVALLAQSVEGFTAVVTEFMRETKLQNEALARRIDAGLEYQRSFYQEHKAVLEDAKRYINQNPIELLRKGG